jgi:hypothetical protein
MNHSISMLLLGGALLATQGIARAQAAGGCPQMPGDAGLHWEHKASNGADFCRALRADGSEAFGMYISAEPTFDPDRSNREEKAQVDGQNVYWYRAEIATKPGVEARETVVRLADGRSAHIWLQAADMTHLTEGFRLAQSLNFNASDHQLVAGE